ncbi:MAG: hypothetical protein JEZ04_22200 [Spirochaetales bacterium]|nr:hypothetical protein [Spirochaetales bacterium]
MNNKKSSILLFLVISFSLLVIGCSGVLFDNPSDSGDTSTADTLSGDCAITAFTINGINGAIDGTDISLTLPYGTDLTNLVASFVTSGQNVTVSEVEQISGQTANNFSIPVEYTVYAENGDTEIYTVTACSEPEPYHPNTVSFWKFDENRGVTAYDSIGSNDGVIHGASWVSGHNGSALDFDGDSDWVEIPDDVLLNINEEITVVAWVKISEHKSSKIIEKETWNSGWSLNQDVWDGWEAGVFMQDGTRLGLGWGEGRPELNEWYHLAITYDEEEFKFFVDGVLKDSVSTGNTIKLNNKPVSIGSDEGMQKFFAGMIDEIALYDTAMTEENILTNYYDG